MKKAAVHNLGCKVNSYELDLMVQQLQAAGYEMVPFDSKADLYVVNTCTVTNIADRKSRQMLHKAKHENPDAIVVAVGCYVDTDRERIEQDPLVDLCIGNDRKENVAKILQTWLEEKHNGSIGMKKMVSAKGDVCTGGDSFVSAEGKQQMHSDGVERAAVPERKPEKLYLQAPGRTRADIKIQDGCNQFCTYCIIPYARGRIRSRNPEDVVEEVKLLAAEGVKEVVLTGIHISSYGKDKGQNPEDALLDLLVKVQMIAGIERIRLGSLEPRIMTEKFIRGIAGLSRVCPHFHLSLQSGCDATLRRMNRHYTSEEYRRGVELLRQYYDRPAITTDVIVGFAGETEEEFAESKAFCEEIGFYEIHVFKYSVRHGTAAAKLPNQCSPELKAKRSDLLLEMTHAQARAYRENFLGEPEEILLEETVELEGREYYVGHTMRYVKGLVPAEGHHAGELVRGTFTALADGTDAVWMQE